MAEYTKALKQVQSTKDFLVAIDSDGCVFDAMGIKQRECFCPMMIACFGLQPVAQAARECKEFADLFSKTRGANRHKTLFRILTELLPSHPMVKARGFKVPQFKYYFDWVNDPKSLLSNDGLEKAIVEAINPDAKKEFADTVQIGYGLDGDEATRRGDFTAVRGTFEEDGFVSEIEQHIISKTAIGDELISRMESLRQQQLI